MTRKDIYYKVVRLTKRLYQTGIPKKIFNCAINGDSKKIDAIFDSFSEYYPKLYSDIIKFGKDFKKFMEDWPECAIFGIKQDEKNGIFEFDINLIDARSFYLLTIMANISDYILFQPDEVSFKRRFLTAIEKETTKKFVEFVEAYNICYLIDCENGETIGEILVSAVAHGFFIAK